MMDSTHFSYRTNQTASEETTAGTTRVTLTSSKGSFIYTIAVTIVYTMAFVTRIMEHYRSAMKDRSDDPSHHRTMSKCFTKDL